MRLYEKKGLVDDAGLVNTIVRTQGVIEGPMYHPNPIDGKYYLEYMSSFSFSNAIRRGTLIPKCLL